MPPLRRSRGILMWRNSVKRRKKGVEKTGECKASTTVRGRKREAEKGGKPSAEGIEIPEISERRGIFIRLAIWCGQSFGTSLCWWTDKRDGRQWRWYCEFMNLPDGECRWP